MWWGCLTGHRREKSAALGSILLLRAIAMKESVERSWSASDHIRRHLSISECRNPEDYLCTSRVYRSTQLPENSGRAKANWSPSLASIDLES